MYMWLENRIIINHANETKRQDYYEPCKGGLKKGL